MGRAPCCDKANVKKGPWSPEEDAKLKSYIEEHGTGGNWIALPQKIGLKRCGKSCRLRWLNYLRPNIKHGGFTEEEENIICSLYISIGSRWSIIAAQLPGRTDNDIKNYWNTRLKKKLMAKQRKDQQAVSRAGLLEHELKRESDSYLFTQTPNHIPGYWAEGPLVAGLHTTMHPNQDDANLGSQDQLMTRLLMKIGGQFYDDPQVLSNNGGITYQYNPIQDQIYADFSPVVAVPSGVNNYIQCSNTTEYESQGGAGFSMNSGLGSATFPTDMEAYMNSLMSFEGSASYSGVDGGNNSSNTPSSTSVGTTSWGEMSSLVNTPVSDFDVYQQGMMLQKVSDQ